MVDRLSWSLRTYYAGPCLLYHFSPCLWMVDQGLLRVFYYLPDTDLNILPSKVVDAADRYELYERSKLKDLNFLFKLLIPLLCVSVVFNNIAVAAVALVSARLKERTMSDIYFFWYLADHFIIDGIAHRGLLDLYLVDHNRFQLFI